MILQAFKKLDEFLGLAPKEQAQSAPQKQLDSYYLVEDTHAAKSMYVSGPLCSTITVFEGGSVKKYFANPILEHAKFDHLVGADVSSKERPKVEWHEQALSASKLLMPFKIR